VWWHTSIISGSYRGGDQPAQHNKTLTQEKNHQSQIGIDTQPRKGPRVTKAGQTPKPSPISEQKRGNNGEQKCRHAGKDGNLHQFLTAFSSTHPQDVVNHCPKSGSSLTPCGVLQVLNVLFVIHSRFKNGTLRPFGPYKE
jgi:hypothetical protein